MSSYDLLILVSSLLGTVGNLAFVYVVVVTYRGQMNAEVFMSCNERYQRIMDSFPRDAWKVRLNMSHELPPPSIELSLSVLSYLNLSLEEFYLYKNKYVHPRVWKMWEEELIRSLKSPLIKREWQILKKEFLASILYLKTRLLQNKN